MQLEGKAAVVTGSATGVGRATALSLAASGCSVLVNYSRSQDDAQQTAAEVERLGVKAVLVQADVADDAACRSMITEATRAFGRLDILVNNAGTTRFIDLADLDEVQEDDWQRMMGVNVRGPFQCARAAKEPLLAGGGGEIVNVSSIAAFLGRGSSIPYCASKAALNNLTLSLARVFAPKIRVNAVAPGFIDGRWLRNGLGDKFAETLKTTAQQAPLGAVSQPEDIAQTILGLITGSDLVTGQIHVCDAGVLAIS